MAWLNRLLTTEGECLSLWQLARGALRLDPNTFHAAVSQENGLFLALILLALGGISLTLGQSAILFANRVPPRRFPLSLGGGALLLAASAFLWSISLWLSSRLILDETVSFHTALTLVALSYTPLLLGFLVFLPYLGNIIYPLLRVWALLTLLVGVGVVFNLDFGPALLCVTLGWIVVELLHRMPFLDLVGLESRLWQRTTGIVQALEPDALADRLAEESRLGSARDDRREDDGELS